MLKRLFKKTPKDLFPEQKHIVELAFTLAGREYYTFADPFNAPYQRALTAIIFYREVSMNCDYDLLEKHTEAINETLMANRIDVFRIKQLNDLLTQRLKLPKDTELLYKLASVVYFDKDESPEVYDFEYAKKKIAFWKEHATLREFFFQKPIVELIPYLKHADENLENYSLIVDQFKKVHSDILSDTSSLKPKTKSSTSETSSQAATPQNSKA
jgi:hypothetical protein